MGGKKQPERCKWTAVRLTGFWSALVIAICPLASLCVAVPARSGPNCLENCVSYPYTDIGQFYPGDYWWMYPMTVAAFALIVFAASALYAAPPERRVFGSIGLGFAVLSGTVLSICYFVQIEVIQPSVLAGETDGIAVLTQYNEHGLFIALEDLGYLAMSFTLLAIAFAFAPHTRLHAAMRWIAGINFMLVLGAFLYIQVVFHVARSYHFEVVAISADWLAMLLLGSLAAVSFFRNLFEGGHGRQSGPQEFRNE